MESEQHICVTGLIQEPSSAVCLTKQPGWAKGQGKRILWVTSSLPPPSANSCPEQFLLLCSECALHIPHRAAALVPRSHASQVVALAGLGQAAKQMPRKQGKLTLWHRSTHFKA